MRLGLGNESQAGLAQPRTADASSRPLCRRRLHAAVARSRSGELVSRLSVIREAHKAAPHRGAAKGTVRAGATGPRHRNANHSGKVPRKQFGTQPQRQVTRGPTKGPRPGGPAARTSLMRVPVRKSSRVKGTKIAIRMPKVCWKSSAHSRHPLQCIGSVSPDKGQKKLFGLPNPCARLRAGAAPRPIRQEGSKLVLFSRADGGKSPPTVYSWRAEHGLSCRYIEPAADLPAAGPAGPRPVPSAGTSQLLGPPGGIGYRFGRWWPVLEACPECGVRVPRDREACACWEADFSPPALQGTEVFA
jgi:hypothetical protein